MADKMQHVPFEEAVKTFKQEQIQLLLAKTTEKLYNDDYWRLLKPRMSSAELDSALAQIADVIEKCQKELDRRKANG